VPSATAFAGAWYGARLKFRQERKAELARVLDEAVKVLEQADQKRSAAYGMFVQDGANTTERGWQVLNDFRSELSTAALVRAQMSLSEAPNSRVYQKFDAALEALSEIALAYVRAATWPNHQHHLAPLQDLHNKIKAGEATFEEARTGFQDAARKRVRR
jgi:hypothetical protein